MDAEPDCPCWICKTDATPGDKTCDTCKEEHVHGRHAVHRRLNRAICAKGTASPEDGHRKWLCAKPAFRAEIYLNERWIELRSGFDTPGEFHISRTNLRLDLGGPELDPNVALELKGISNAPVTVFLPEVGDGWRVKASPKTKTLLPDTYILREGVHYQRVPTTKELTLELGAYKTKFKFSPLGTMDAEPDCPCWICKPVETTATPGGRDETCDVCKDEQVHGRHAAHLRLDRDICDKSTTFPEAGHRKWLCAKPAFRAEIYLAKRWIELRLGFGTPAEFRISRNTLKLDLGDAGLDPAVALVLETILNAHVNVFVGVDGRWRVEAALGSGFPPDSYTVDGKPVLRGRVHDPKVPITTELTLELGRYNTPFRFNHFMAAASRFK
jgi:hypothetical protein